MILADTSVWIRALAGRQPYWMELDRLADRAEVAGHELVYGELLIGDRGGRAAMLMAYGRIPWARPVAHPDVVVFVRGRGLLGRGIGWIDAHLLAAALLEQWPLWTADERLAELAEELGVSWSAAQRRALL